MSENHREASLQILKFAANEAPTSQQIQQSFNRLALRYPQLNFPEKFGAIKKAYDLLIDPVRSYDAILSDSALDLSFIEDGLKKTSSTKDVFAAVRAQSSDQFLAMMLKKTLVEH